MTRSVGTSIDESTWHHSSLNPSACVKIEGTYAKGAGAQFVTAHEDAVWALERKLTSGRVQGVGATLGVQTYAEWKPETTALRTYGVITTVPKLAFAEDVITRCQFVQGQNPHLAVTKSAAWKPDKFETSDPSTNQLGHL